MQILLTLSALLFYATVTYAQQIDEVPLPEPKSLGTAVAVELIDLRVTLLETGIVPSTKDYTCTARFRIRMSSGDVVHKAIQVSVSQLPNAIRQSLKNIHDDVLQRFLTTHGLK